MTDETKRRGRPPKQADAPEADASDLQADATTEDTHAEQAAQAEEAQAPKEMTFAEVMAWNRANADLLPPLPKKQLKKPRKMKAM